MLGGGRQGGVPNRPELIELHGWDVKYGSHALRLAYQGHQIATEATLSLPLREEQWLRVLAVKRGEVPREEVSEEIDGIEAAIRDLLDRGACAVPLHPDRPAIEKWSIDAHRRTWGW